MNVYNVTYAAQMYDTHPSTINIRTNDTYKKGTGVIIYKKGRGFFIGVIGDEQDKDTYTNDYRILVSIDTEFNKALSIVENENRKEELKKQMQERFAVIDEEKKFAYYASLDSELNSMYEEYKQLGGDK